MLRNLMTLVMVALSLVALADKVTLKFATKGPDRYADGAVVSEREYYALVWVKDGVTFKGFNADGTLAGHDASEARILTFRTSGRDTPGRLGPNNYQLDTREAEQLNGGTVKLFVLDTRLASKRELAGASTVGLADSVNFPRAVNGYGEATSVAFSMAGASAAASSITFAATASQIPQGVKNPVIKSIVVKGGFAYLTVAETDPCLQYTITAGDSPATMVQTNASKNAQNGDRARELLFVVPVDGDHRFFKVNRNGLERLAK